jgi:hypothetical protein
VLRQAPPAFPRSRSPAACPAGHWPRARHSSAYGPDAKMLAELATAACDLDCNRIGMLVIAPTAETGWPNLKADLHSAANDPTALCRPPNQEL